MLALFLALAAATLSAQEIQGVVSDPTLNIGIAGATVTLSEAFASTPNRSLASTTTDSQGAFHFTPAKFGKYTIEVHKASLMDASHTSFAGTIETSQTVTLSAAHPSADLRFALIEPGQLTGRVVDEQANPIADLAIAVHSRSASLPFLNRALTAKDGTFTISSVPPGSYIVEAIPKLSASFSVVKFSAPEFNSVDQDFESSYWPGGAADPRSAFPVTVSSGAPTSVGVIKLRKEPYYRVHLTLNDACTAGPDWKVMVTGASGRSALAHFSCMQEFLIGYLRPGSYLLGFSNEQYGPVARWALLPVQITNRNLELKLAMSRPGDLRGRIVTLNDAPLPSVTMLKLSPIPLLPGLMQQMQTTVVNDDGTFAAADLPWPREQLTLAGLNSNYYVKEIRVAGVASPDQTVPLIPGASPPIEIVVDNQAATLAGAVLDGDKPVSQAVIVLTGPRQVTAGPDGTFQIGGLPPREYRVLALPPGTPPYADFANLLLTAPSVTLERGDSKRISLRLTSPSQ